MAIDILPIHDILNYHFEIPNYQRGYRWDDEQVLARQSRSIQIFTLKI